MATLFEQSISQNTRCFSCGALVYAVEKKLTTNHVYHDRCFRCRICKRNLTGYSLNEDGDDIYCGNCYRRKQRGDCDSLEFHRAAAEKAQYVHNRYHPDQQNSLHTPRTATLRDITRHPSLTLRQLERQFLSFQPASKATHKDDSQRSFSCYHPTTTISNLTKYRHDSTLTKDEPSPHFSPVFSPISTIRTETTITPRVIQKSNEIIINDETLPTSNGSGGIEFRLNKSTIDLTHVTSPQTNRKSIIIPDLNQPLIEPKDTKFHFPDFIRRRSSSANQRINSLRVD